MGSNCKYQGVLAQNCSATEKTEIPYSSLMLQWDDASMFISSQSQELHLKFVKQVSQVEGSVALGGTRVQQLCPADEKFVVDVV